MKTGIIVQTRMGSTRLPGKVMKALCGKPVIEHVIDRLKQCAGADEIIIATTNMSQDDVIVEQAEKNGVKWYRGSQDDVLSRYYGAAEDNKLELVVRVTSDCPLIDPKLIDEMLGFYLQNKYDIVTNAGSDVSKRTFPRGLDNEIFSFGLLEEAHRTAKETYQREHVTPYIYENSHSIYYYMNETDYSRYRWTLDTEEDFMLIETVYRHLYKGKHDFYFSDILKLMQHYPEIAYINQHVEQKKLKD